MILGLESSERYGRRFSIAYRRTEFIASFLDTRPEKRNVTVYYPGDLRQIWFDLGTRSYFNPVQLSGCAFNRSTAIEGRRRARLVRAFEAEHLRRHPMVHRYWQQALTAFYDADNLNPPEEEDLVALCADEGIDFAIVTQRFDGLYCSTNGTCYVYDCASVRRMAQVRAADQPRRSSRP